MKDGYLTRGDKVRAKLIRHGNPIEEASVVDTDLALYGSMKVKLSSGEIAPAFYPPVEVMTG